MRQQVAAAQDDPEAWVPLLNQLIGERWSELNQALMALVAANASRWTPRRSTDSISRRIALQNHLYGMQREIEQLAPWLVLLNQPPALFTRPDGPPAIRDGLASAARGLADCAQCLKKLSRICTRPAWRTCKVSATWPVLIPKRAGGARASPKNYPLPGWPLTIC